MGGGVSPAVWLEVRLLGLSVLTGAGLMILYDLLRLWRALIRHGWLWVGVEDFFYWIFAGFAVFYLLYRENDGTLRLYVIALVLASMAVYDHFCSTFSRKVLKKLSDCFKIKKNPGERERRRKISRELSGWQYEHAEKDQKKEKGPLGEPAGHYRHHSGGV